MEDGKTNLQVAVKYSIKFFYKKSYKGSNFRSHNERNQLKTPVINLT